MFNRALADSVSSEAPRGALRPGLSTYWIDRAEQRARQAALDGSPEPVASGNVAFLRIEGSYVVAAYEFDPDGDDAEAVPLEVFLDLLGKWRRRVVEAGGGSGPEAQMMSGPGTRPAGPASD